MILPEQLEELRSLKVWVCYPMIWNETKHNGVGGFDKPPICAYTLDNAKINDATNLATFDEAAAHIGEITTVTNKGARVECEIKGVGIALGFTGLIGVDLDNVVAYHDGEYKITPEAGEIIKALASYTELSPSCKGIHILIKAEMPDDYQHKAKDRLDNYGKSVAEYELLDKGYITISGITSSRYDYPLSSRATELAVVYERYFVDVEPIETPSTQKPSNIRPITTRPSALSPVVSSVPTYERWLEEVKRLSDAEVLERIFMSGETGKRVKSLYAGNMSAYNNDHSVADQALCSYLYSFTADRALTERLFRTSALYRATGKGRGYIDRTLNKAASKSVQLVGHIEFTKEEKKQYAQKKQREESKNDFKPKLKPIYTKRG